MHDSTSPEDMRILAERFRQMAEAASLPEYARSMAKAAFDLEQRAAALESSKRVVFLPFSPEANAQALARSFGDTIPLLSAR